MADGSNSLDAIGLHAGTDKASNHHNYLNFYDPFFTRWRDLTPKVLEIGVHEGASLKTWKEYFPHAHIVGVDINPSCKALEGDRISIEILDQGNVQDLVHLGVTHGPFDVVIEDGSHLWEHQITSLRTIFPFIRDGGIYVVEDLQTNFGESSPYQGISSQSCAAYLTKAMQLCVADNVADTEDPFLRTYARFVTLCFYPGCCLIQKRPGARSEHGTDVAPNASSEAALVVVQAHIGGVGDVTSLEGSIRSQRPGGAIEGLTLYGNRFLTTELYYRARREDGSWTPWVGLGTFAGSKGEARSLTGFAVRPSEPTASPITIRTVGTFRGKGDPIVVSAGGECVSPNGEPLFGLEIHLSR